MEEKTGFFTSFDGTKLYYRAWKKNVPDNLFIVHGYGEYSDRYEEMVRALSDLPLSIFIHDLRGHGRSEGKRVYVDRLEQLIDDEYQFKQFVDQTYGTMARAPILFGHSLGALISSFVAIKNQAAWSALVLSSPFFAIYSMHSFAKHMAFVLNSVAPRMVINNPVKSSYLTHNPDEAIIYNTDPYIYRMITVRMINELLTYCDLITKRAHEITLPTYVFAAGDDRVVSLKRTQKIYEEIKSHDKILQVFPGYYHETFHEIGKDKVITMLRSYLAHFLSTGRFNDNKQ